jgi:hypothetical protein
MVIGCIRCAIQSHYVGIDTTWLYPNQSMSCTQVRPLNQRELDDGNRVCTHYDAETKQIALTVRDCRASLLDMHVTR